MQGLGTGAITLAGSDGAARALAAAGRARRGDHRLRALRAGGGLGRRRAGDDARAATATHWVLDGEKTWISNGGIADVYCVFARTGEAPGAKGISAFVVPADTPGLTVAERIDVIAPHPLARLAFDGCRVPADALLGAPGDGFKLAMRTLDIFRASVAAAALGFARRALDEAVAHAARAPDVRRPLADLQLTQATLGEHGDRHRRRRAARLPRRVEARHRRERPRTTREAAMAKLAATEAAQRVDRPRRAAPRRPRACASARWSSASTARSARCASTRARARCSG